MSGNTSPLLPITDLDGCLLDETNSTFAPAADQPIAMSSVPALGSSVPRQGRSHLPATAEIVMSLVTSARRLCLPILALIGAGVTTGTTIGCKHGDGIRGADSAVIRFLLPATERTAWQPIAASFTAAHPGVRVELIEGPNSTDLRESLLSTSLLARDPTYDLLYIDVTWTAKFAAAGWLRDLSSEFDAARARFLPPALAAGIIQGRLYRIPVRTDVGCLYYRQDLLAAAGEEPPSTFAQLAAVAQQLGSPPERYGFVWQGKQYEGLVCTYLEVLTGFGGTWIDPVTLRVGLDEPVAEEALGFLIGCMGQGISPPGVLGYQEEESRRLFQDGRAVLLRSWPYVWQLAQRDDSPLRGRIGAGPMVAAAGGRRAATLGGWGLAVSAYSRAPALAADFIRHATSLESQRMLCSPTGYAPALRAAYDDSTLIAANPFLKTVLALHENAVARPALVDYSRASDILQRRLSAALSRRQTADEALAGATRETRQLLAAVADGSVPLPSPRDGS
jgi:multiple sugar transport system substrate-binding protein